MFLLPLLMIAIVGVAIYTVMHRRTHPATVTAHAPAAESTHLTPFWPTTIEGKVGIAAFALSFAPVVLVSVIQVPYLGIVTLLASLVLTGMARFAKHDRSISVLVAFSVAALAALAGLLFLAGEIFIGHD
jgi:hypothetical protein